MLASQNASCGFHSMRRQCSSTADVSTADCLTWLYTMPPIRTRAAADPVENRKLVLAIDIGTTFTAVSYCLVQPSNQPGSQRIFEEVLRWPKQITPDAKIPSAIFYDKAGSPKAFGAETEDEEVRLQAEEQEWHRAEWWKLRLRPKHLAKIEPLPTHVLPLPENVSLSDIYVNFLKYLKQNVKEYLTSNHTNGARIWDALAPSMNVILSTPNGWEGAEQQAMRQAAIDAGLVDEAGGSRVRFVTEAEAAIHHVAKQGNIQGWLVPGNHLILCDAGGGTVDITAYKVVATKPKLLLEESAASQCYLAGSVYVKSAAEEYLQHLQDTKWDNEEKLRIIMERFDLSAKKKFSAEDEHCYITLSEESTTTIQRLGITRGRLKISGATMSSFFNHPTTKTKEGIMTVFKNSGQQADKIILVGGLSESPFFYSNLLEWSDDNGFSLFRPKGSLSKVVPNGALHWHLDCVVESRVVKAHYGSDVLVAYDNTNEDHVQLAQHMFADIDGKTYLRGAWHCIVAKDRKIHSGKDFRKPFTLAMKEDTTEFDREESIYVYRRGGPPTFIRLPGNTEPKPGFELICVCKANLKDCFDASPSKFVETSGIWVRTVKFEICLSLGGTELSARVKWLKKGKPVYGPATIAYI
ncbi:hypothetical protein C8F01DRAFT_30135 [Mycena amicta]|nr:hypothetical protein C8F01DRAFT_30135 [Mycena amicta]